MEAHIAVICLERDIVEPYYTSWIRVDNRAIGRMIGQFVVDYLTKKYGEPRGNIVEIAGLKGVEAEANRKLGAHDVWDKYPKIKVVTEAVANWSQSLAKDRMTEILSAVPQIDVVYGRSDPMAVGAYLAAREQGREKEMIFVGIDGLAGEAGGVNQGPGGHSPPPASIRSASTRRSRSERKSCTIPISSPRSQYTIPSSRFLEISVSEKRRHIGRYK
jgi:ABC-type sugar transport system substrate-binding protein